MVNPTHLYRSILRAHRHLPKEMRFVGDQYVRAEFRNHRTVSDKAFLKPFFAQWESYLTLIQEQTASSQTPNTSFGRQLDQETISKLDDDKAQQLLDLHDASRGKDLGEHPQDMVAQKESSSRAPGRL